MENKEYLDNYEITIYKAIHEFLLSKGEVDKMKPDAPDIEDMWERICQSYMTDGVREFNGYPTVSIGWMMFIGMAVAQLWDEDWEKYSKEKDLYFMLREVRGFDCLDEYICEDVLKLNPDEAKTLTKLVGDVAVLAHRALLHEGFEPGTPMAFHAYIRTIHQMYLSGAAVQLKRMGYHMSKL